MVEPCMDLTEDYGVDASSWSASVMMVNTNADEIVLPCFTCVGSLVPMSAVLVALAEPVLPGEVCGTLPDHLEDIAAGTTPWGRAVGCCSGTSSVGTCMFSRRPGNL